MRESTRAAKSALRSAWSRTERRVAYLGESCAPAWCWTEWAATRTWGAPSNLACLDLTCRSAASTSSCATADSCRWHPMQRKVHVTPSVCARAPLVVAAALSDIGMTLNAHPSQPFHKCRPGCNKHAGAQVSCRTLSEGCAPMAKQCYCYHHKLNLQHRHYSCETVLAEPIQGVRDAS